jgi:hypothetical protein
MEVLQRLRVLHSGSEEQAEGPVASQTRILALENPSFLLIDDLPLGFKLSLSPLHSPLHFPRLKLLLGLALQRVVA